MEENTEISVHHNHCQMSGFDLAELYEVDTKVLNQSVKRHLRRFPNDFLFRLSVDEWQAMRSQFVTASEMTVNLRTQIITPYQSRRNTKVTPFAFTEQGVATLSGILNSEKAISMNIAIMRAFVELRRLLSQQSNFKEQLKEIKQRLGEHDTQLNQIYDAIENLLDENAAKRKWEEREKIGFNK